MADMNPITAGSKMISNGIDEFAVGLGDDMLNMSSSMGANHTNATDNLIMQISTFTYNPFRDPSIISGMIDSFAIYFLFVVAFIFLAGAYVMASNARGTRLLLGQVIHHGMSKTEYFTLCIILIIIPPFVAFLMWIPLIINYILTSLLMSAILPSIMPSPDNVVLYLGMCIVYLMMMFAFVWRAIIIGLSVKFAFFILLLIIIPVTRKLGWWIFIYYMIMVFLQVIIIACTIGGIGVITYLAGGHNIFLPGYFVLGMFLATIALIFIFGPLTIMRLMSFGKRMVLRF